MQRVLSVALVFTAGSVVAARLDDCIAALQPAPTGLCGAGHAAGAAALLSLEACLAGAPLGSAVSTDFAQSIASRYGALGAPCAGGSPAEHILTPVATAHQKLGAANKRTPFVSTACQPTSMGGCAYTGRLLDDVQVNLTFYRRQRRLGDDAAVADAAHGDGESAPLQMAAPLAIAEEARASEPRGSSASRGRSLQNVADPSFSVCPPFGGSFECSPRATAGGPSNDDGGSSTMDIYTVNASRALSKVELQVVDAGAVLNLTASARYPAQMASVAAAVAAGAGAAAAPAGAWTAADIALVAASLATTPASGGAAGGGPLLVTLSLCHGWMSWLAGCARPALYVDAARDLCVFDSPPPRPAGARNVVISSASAAATAPELGVFTAALGMWVARPNATRARLPFAGPSCPAAGAPRVTMMLVGAATVRAGGDNASITLAAIAAARGAALGMPRAPNGTIPSWLLWDPVTGGTALVAQALAGDATALVGGVAMSAPIRLRQVARAPAAFPPGPLAPVTVAAATAAGIAPVTQRSLPNATSVPAVSSALGAATLSYVWTSVDGSTWTVPAASAVPSGNSSSPAPRPAAAAAALSAAAKAAASDPSLLAALRHFALRKASQLHGSPLMPVNISDVWCRFVGVGSNPSVAAARTAGGGSPTTGAPAAIPRGQQWLCQLTLATVDATVHRRAKDRLGLTLSLYTQPDAGAPPPPAFDRTGSVAALSASTVLAWQELQRAGLPQVQVGIYAPEGTPLTPGESAAIKGTLIFLGVGLGLALLALIVDRYYRANPARNGAFAQLNNGDAAGSGGSAGNTSAYSVAAAPPASADGGIAMVGISGGPGGRAADYALPEDPFAALPGSTGGGFPSTTGPREAWTPVIKSGGGEIGDVWASSTFGSASAAAGAGGRTVTYGAEVDETAGSAWGVPAVGHGGYAPVATGARPIGW